MLKQNRPISSAESEVVLAALRRAPAGTVSPALADAVGHLTVIGRCECGCPSIDFASRAELGQARPIADGIGRTAGGAQVGILVWGTDEAITGLEVYELGEPAVELPDPHTIEPWEGKGQSGA